MLFRSQLGRVLRLPSIGGIGGAVEVTTGAVAGKQRYTVVAGDTLLTIALRYNIAWQEVAAVNGLQEFDLLQIGQEIALPASLDETAKTDESVEEAETAEATTAPETDAAAQEEEANPPAASGFASDRLRNTPAPESTQNAAPARYTVRPGDTPLGIALSHSIALNDLLRANGLSEADFLQIGQALEIPGAGEEAAEAAAEPATAAPP